MFSKREKSSPGIVLVCISATNFLDYYSWNGDERRPPKGKSCFTFSRGDIAGPNFGSKLRQGCSWQHCRATFSPGDIATNCSSLFPKKLDFQNPLGFPPNISSFRGLGFPPSSISTHFQFPKGGGFDYIPAAPSVASHKRHLFCKFVAAVMIHSFDGFPHRIPSQATARDMGRVAN